MTIGRAGARAAALAMLVLACARPSTTAPPSEPASDTSVRDADRDGLDSTTCTELVARDRRSATTPRHAAPNVLAWHFYPLDTDGDAYDDVADECVRAPEDFDGFEDHDGCPDCDNDGDGIPDADIWVLLEHGPGWANRDRDGELDCRNEPEDLDGDRDHDGCPDE